MESSQNYFTVDNLEKTLDVIERDDNDQFELPLKEKIELSHDTFKFVFKLPKEDQVLGLPVGGHICFHIPLGADDFLTRKYTPVSSVNEKGTVTFVIKVYRKSEEFENGGKMSQMLENLQPGDKVKMEGPKGLLSYLGHGNFQIKKDKIKKTKVGLIAGGTGITPMYQLVQSSSLAKDEIEMTLIYSNKTIYDILCKDDLESFAKMNPTHFKLFHTLTRHDDDKHGVWTELRGRVCSEILKKCSFPEPSPETLVCYCGPAPFNKCVEDILGSMGYTKDMMHKF